MKNDFPYLGCILLIVVFVFEVLVLYFLANIFIPLPWWVALTIVLGLNLGFGIYKRIGPKKNDRT